MFVKFFFSHWKIVLLYTVIISFFFSDYLEKVCTRKKIVIYSLAFASYTYVVLHGLLSFATQEKGFYFYKWPLEPSFVLWLCLCALGVACTAGIMLAPILTWIPVMLRRVLSAAGRLYRFWDSL